MTTLRGIGIVVSMTTARTATITDAPNGCGYRINYIDRTGCATYATVSDYGTAKRFAAAVERDDNDAMNGRTRPFVAENA